MSEGKIARRAGGERLGSTTQFGLVPDWLLGMSTAAVKVYIVLDFHSNGDVAFPGCKRIAELAGIHISTVRRAVKELEELGALERKACYREDGGQTTNDYRLWREPKGGRKERRGRLPVGSGLARANSALDLDSKETSNEVSVAVARIFEHWKAARSKASRTKQTPGREKKILARLKEFTEADLLRAIDAVALDPWKDRRLHDDLTVIFRSTEQVERFLALADRPPAPRKRASGAEAADALLEDVRQLGRG